MSRLYVHSLYAVHCCQYSLSLSLSIFLSIWASTERERRLASSLLFSHSGVYFGRLLEDERVFAAVEQGIYSAAIPKRIGPPFPAQRKMELSIAQHTDPAGSLRLIVIVSSLLLYTYNTLRKYCMYRSRRVRR